MPHLPITKPSRPRRLPAFEGRSRGFSGLELTISLIILGMTFLLALKGAAAVTAIRVYVLTRQIETYQSAVLQYVSDWNMLPGDDVVAPERWGKPPALYLIANRAVSVAGDGKIDGELDDPGSPLGEQYLAWQDLRYGGYVVGDRTQVGQLAQPGNMFGGVFGLASDEFGLNQVLCLTKVPGEEAAAIDRRLDDGNVATGRLRGTSRWDPTGAHNHFMTPDTAPYSPDKTYIICLPYLP